MEESEANRVRAALIYEPLTGVFRRRASGKGPNNKAGGVAGYLRPDGYVDVRVASKTYPAHRIAFVCMGEPVPSMVDHVNRARGDNRWANLRPATARLNRLNQRGVGVLRYNKKWVARLSHVVVARDYCFGRALMAYQSAKAQAIKGCAG